MPTTAPTPQLYGLSGAGLTSDAGGQRIDGRRVLDISGVQDNSSGMFGQEFADAQGFGDLWRSGYTPRVAGQLFDDPDVQSEAFSPELMERLRQYQVARLGFGNDLRQHAVIGPDGNVVSASRPRAYSGFKDFAAMAVPMMLGVAAPGLGSALGSALGASGAAAPVVGNALVGGGLSALAGGDPLRGALTGGLGAFASPYIGAAGAAASEAAGGGALGEALRGATSGGLRSLVGGAVNGRINPANLLTGALRGGLNAGTNALTSGFDAGNTGSFIPGFFEEGGEGAADPTMPFEDFFSDDPAAQYGSMYDEILPYEAPPSAPAYSDPYDNRFYREPGGLGNMGGEGSPTIPWELISGGSYSPSDGSGAAGVGASGLTQLLQRLLGGNAPSTGTLNTIGGLLGALGQYRSASRGPQSASQLYSGLPGANQTMSDAHRAAQQKVFTSPLTQASISANPMLSYGVDPMAPKYAEGGEVMEGEEMMEAPLSMIASDLEQHVQGPGGGQDDMIDARLSPGEYVFDADVVSALGDGSNEAGAAKLDEFRQRIREHKRSAPPTEIPPPARPIEAYMNGG